MKFINNKNRKEYREIKKIAKMVDEVTTYFLEKKVYNLDIKVEQNEDLFTLYFSGIVNLSKDEYEYLEKILNNDYNVEYEDFWSLLGEGLDSGELELIGKLTKCVKMDYSNNLLIFILERKRIK